MVDGWRCGGGGLAGGLSKPLWGSVLDVGVAALSLHCPWQSRRIRGETKTRMVGSRKMTRCVADVWTLDVVPKEEKSWSWYQGVRLLIDCYTVQCTVGFLSAAAPRNTVKFNRVAFCGTTACARPCRPLLAEEEGPGVVDIEIAFWRRGRVLGEMRAMPGTRTTRTGVPDRRPWTVWRQRSRGDGEGEKVFRRRVNLDSGRWWSWAAGEQKIEHNTLAER